MPTFYYYKKRLLFSLIYYKILIRKDVYNINVGGDGGWSYINNKS